MAKRRLDEALVARGLVPSRERAAALIMAGKVTVDGRAETKAGTQVADGAAVAVAPEAPYASRGGEKLAHALDEFGAGAEGRVALDVGASTGGFTSCLLARGARHVHALDVGRGLLAWRLRTDERVTVWEGFNAREFDASALEPSPSLLVVDVSFISLALVLKPLVPTLGALVEIVALVKPQFEARREQVGPKGVVSDAAVHEEVLSRACRLFDDIGVPAIGVTRSPLKGPAGNREFFVHGVVGAAKRDLDADVVAAAHGVQALETP
ncbi:MAG: TlyA family RNA methyltransferase [Candidatus Zixiibacteriota bacterium]